MTAGGAQTGATGTIEFMARVTPSAGRAEPVRQFTFYLLRKSFADISREAAQAEQAPDLNAFVEALEVSPALKAWMKKTHSVSLAGEDFVHRLKPDDIMNVHEFFDAYIERNADDQSFGFPSPKYRERDKTRDPAKYRRQMEEYRAAVRKFLEANSQSAEGIDLSLVSIDPHYKWDELEAQNLAAIRRRSLSLAQTRYLVAQSDTDLGGRAALSHVAPGEYWLSTLEMEATAGDARLRWDVPVEVLPGRISYVELSNANAVEPARRIEAQRASQ